MNSNFRSAVCSKSLETVSDSDLVVKESVLLMPLIIFIFSNERGASLGITIIFTQTSSATSGKTPKFNKAS